MAQRLRRSFFAWRKRHSPPSQKTASSPVFPCGTPFGCAARPPAA